MRAGAMVVLAACAAAWIAGCVPLGPSEPPLLVAVGDSLVRDWPLAPEFPEMRIHNAGRGGDRLSGVSRRLAALPGTGEAEAVVVLAGANDSYALVGMPGAEDSLRIALGGLLEEADGTGARYLVLSLLPIGEEYPGPGEAMNALHDRANAFLTEEMARRARGRFVDARAALADGHGRLQPRFTTDGLHLNGEGYAALSAVLRKAIHGR